MGCDHRHGDLSCREIFAMLSEYLDEELDASVCSRLEEHLEDCPPCVEFLDSLRRTVGLLRAEGRVEPAPEDLRRELSAALGRLEPPGSR
ncbi:MAG: zf-HC2 domain-containing protein [Acidobacteriota bacterium]|nr:zf-HC2 domain-containing protein [Acidobacteriota bacterium]MDQ7087543.1 zf-HC2 domain-containing protein [Acidobacteriota bacterium]